MRERVIIVERGVATQAKVELGRVGKLRRLAETAVGRIERAGRGFTQAALNGAAAEAPPAAAWPASVSASAAVKSLVLLVDLPSLLSDTPAATCGNRW